MTPLNGLPRALRRFLITTLGLLAAFAALVFSPLLLSPAVGASSPAAAPAAVSAAGQDQGREVLVAVVRTPAQNGGVRDSLDQIAGRTLGNADRAPEVFDLNEGRSQSDGSALDDPALLRPGWILLLPDDARGPDVRTAVLAEPRSNEPASSETPSSETDDRGAGEPRNDVVERLRWPIVLAVIGGLGVAVLTTALVLRRRIRLRLRRVRAAIRTTAAWAAAAWRRRAALRLRSELVAGWHRDDDARDAAVSALSGTSGSPAPVAAEVTAAGTTVLGGTAGSAAGQGAAGENRPRGSTAVARIGGGPTGQVFLDFAQCRGALAIGGDPALALDVARSVVAQLSLASPQLVILSLGPSGLPRSASVATVNDLERFGLLAPAGAAGRTGLIYASDAPPRLLGVLLVQPGRTQEELDDVVARCAAPGSGWLAVHPGEVRGAHWRWTVHRDGRLEVPLLERTLTATGTV